MKSIYIEGDVDKTIMSNYVKYDRLKSLIDQFYQGSNAEILNIYIDLFPIIKSIYRLNSKCMFTDKLSIASCIVNMCAHYRQFFKTRYGVSTNIFLIYSLSTGESNRLFYNKFNKEFITDNRTDNLNGILNDNMVILAEIVQYLPNIMMRASDSVEANILIYDTILKEKTFGNTNPNLVITKDIYTMQLLEMGEDIKILRPYKREGKDESIIIDSSNWIECLIYLRKVKLNITPEIKYIDSGLFGFVLSLTRLPERNIESFISLPIAIKNLSNLISNNKILNAYNNDVMFICEQYNSIKGIKQIDPYFIDQRFKAIDLKYQYGTVNNAVLAYNGIINLFNDIAIKEINEKYFSKIPLDLMVL